MARDETVPKAIAEAAGGRAGIELIGDIDQASVEGFVDQLANAHKQEGDVVLGLTSTGGDPDLVRRIVLDIERARQAMAGHFYFLGKSLVASAAVTVMAAFPARDRFLTRDTILMIHGRQLNRTIELSGPIRTSRAEIEALLAEIDMGLELEEQAFRKLIEGSDIALDELIRKATRDWYVNAQEAETLGLVAALV
jgi:ATP-dependent protease ClpP protease subunit